MPNSPSKRVKKQRLREQGVLHRRPKEVTDPLFQQSDFFDPNDLLQVKYEMLRRVREDRHTVCKAAAEFGLSRPAYYEILAAWENDGLAGLLPKKRGPHSGHKLTDEIVQYVYKLQANNPALTLSALTDIIDKRFGVAVHTRSVERVLKKRKKKRP